MKVNTGAWPRDIDHRVPSRKGMSALVPEQLPTLWRYSRRVTCVWQQGCLTDRDVQHTANHPMAQDIRCGHVAGPVLCRDVHVLRSGGGAQAMWNRGASPPTWQQHQLKVLNRQRPSWERFRGDSCCVDHKHAEGHAAAPILLWNPKTCVAGGPNVAQMQ